VFYKTHSFLSKKYENSFLQGVKRPVHEADHSSQSSSTDENALSYMSA
jgi:hypothetical protein